VFHITLPTLMMHGQTQIKFRIKFNFSRSSLVFTKTISIARTLTHLVPTEMEVWGNDAFLSTLVAQAFTFSWKGSTKVSVRQTVSGQHSNRVLPSRSQKSHSFSPIARFSSFYENEAFITVLTNAYHWRHILIQMESIPNPHTPTSQYLLHYHQAKF
jgi:hypothetical protein